MMLEFNLLKGNSPDWGQTLQIKSSIVSLLFAIKITIGGIIDLMSVLAYACQVTCISQLCSMNREEQKTKHYVPLPSPPFPCEGKQEGMKKPKGEQIISIHFNMRLLCILNNVIGKRLTSLSCVNYLLKLLSVSQILKYRKISLPQTLKTHLFVLD